MNCEFVRTIPPNMDNRKAGSLRWEVLSEDGGGGIGSETGAILLTEYTMRKDFLRRQKKNKWNLS